MSTVVYDGTGRAHTVVLNVEKTADAVPADPTATPPTPYQGATWNVVGAEIAGDPDATPPVAATAIAFTGDSLQFDADGKLTSGGTFDLSGAFPDGSPLDIDLDLSRVTQFGGSSTVGVASQNGSPAGELIDYGFDQQGQLILAFSNGQRRPAAQLALGMVNNPDGLEQVGDGFYSTSPTSGDLRIGKSGAEIPAGIISGALEASNVDLAEEFTDMIVAQRSYQANARVVTTSDELLQETVQLKR